MAQSQVGRAYVFEANGDMLARVRTPGGNWTTACAFGPDGSTLYILEAQTGSVYCTDLATLGD